MAVTGNEHLWGFLRYARANPHGSLNGVHFDELDEMAKIYARVNETGATATETDPGTYDSTTDIPGKTTTNEDDTGVAFQNPTSLLTDQARYPQSHIFTNAGAPI